MIIICSLTYVSRTVKTFYNLIIILIIITMVTGKETSLGTSFDEFLFGAPDFGPCVQTLTTFMKTTKLSIQEAHQLTRDLAGRL